MTRRKPELEKISELGKSPAQKIGGQISFKGKTLEEHYFDFRSMEKPLKSQ